MFITRLLLVRLCNVNNNSKFISDIVRILNKYGLYNVLEHFIENGYFPTRTTLENAGKKKKQYK